MILAVACDGAAVTGHFGHCQSFSFYTVENGVITKEESIPNPGHKPGLLPNLVADFGASVIIAGGMGVHAASIFRERGVEIVTGAEGPARAAAESYLAGELRDKGALCEHHHHDHEA